MWTQHTISDKQGNAFKSGLRDDFGVGPGAGPEAAVVVRRGATCPVRPTP